MYRIGPFSKMGKTTVKTLRYYDEIGLLSPAYTDPENGYRYYTTAQLMALHQIISLRQMGFSTVEIQSIMNGRHVEGILASRKAEIVGAVRDANEQLSRINHYMKEYKEGLHMQYQAVVKEIPECIVYSKRFIAKSYDDFFHTIPAIGEEVGKVNPTLKCAVPEYCFNIYHDGEYREQDIDVEYCEAVTTMGQETETIKFKKMPPISVVSVMHKGPYKTLGKAYAFIFKWIEDNGYTVTDHPRESYIDGIWNKESEEDWLTEVQVPVTK